MNYILSCLLVLFSFTVFSQDFYELNNIQTIEISFAESNWDQQMDNAYAADAGYIMADKITINGISMDSVGVKYKGNSSYRSTQVKNPWHIELNTYKDQDYEGYTDIKLANGAKDPSCIRDVLAYQIIRQYMDAPLANFANLYVNGNLIGLYANTESVSKKFMNSRFGSKNNTRFKCSPPDGAGPQSSDFPNLVYMGQDSTDYYDSYELKSDNGWQELINLCDTLANHTVDIEKILDVDRTLWMLAFDNIIVNLDSYIGAFCQNYYLYKSDFDQFLPIIWDLNESFGGFSMTGTSSLGNTTAKQQMSHLLHISEAQYPLIRNLLNIPMYKRMYLAHFKTLLKENFENNAYLDMAISLRSTIDAAVQADNNKFYSYSNFVNSLNSDVSSSGGGPGGGNSIPGITSLMNTRTQYLLGLSDFTNTEPNITNIILSNNTPSINETISISTTVSNASEVYLGYRNGIPTAPFTRVLMYDDGAHKDGIANDGIYGVDINITNETTEYYIYAENTNIGKFAPARAQYEYLSITATVGNQIESDLVINELMASNETIATDQDGEYDDWIELYNNGSETINLTGYFLSDDASDLTKWTFPEGTSIGPDEYLIVWADNDEQDGLHATFKLSASGEPLFLVNASQEIIDAIEYPEQMTDISYARLPNGTGTFQLSGPTFNTNNKLTTDCANMGGDIDNDGICADEDCDDNDPTIGLSQNPGTICDDNDVATQNDTIQDDGCTCMGVVMDLSDVVINELMASNDATIVDQDGEYDDWIELYNKSNSNIDISGYFLTDDPTNITKWTIPAETSIEANAYLIIWADEDEDQEGLHADFKLSGSGESVILADPDTSVIDAILYPEQTNDKSYGRFPNGTGDFQAMSPTFNAENTNLTNTTNPLSEEYKLQAYPNPAIDKITVYTISDLSQLNIYNINGQKVIALSPNTNINEIDISDLSSGIYIIKALTTDGHIITHEINITK